MDSQGDLWVHERDYGANPSGDFIVGFFLILSGLVGLALAFFRRES